MLSVDVLLLIELALETVDSVLAVEVELLMLLWLLSELAVLAVLVLLLMDEALDSVEAVEVLLLAELSEALTVDSLDVLLLLMELEELLVSVSVWEDVERLLALDVEGSSVNELLLVSLLVTSLWDVSLSVKLLLDDVPAKSVHSSIVTVFRMSKLFLYVREK